MPVGDRQKGGGLPNGARAKHSLATIKQGRRSMRSAVSLLDRGAAAKPRRVVFFYLNNAASQSALAFGAEQTLRAPTVLRNPH